MRRIRLLPALIICAALRAQAPESQPAHLPGEPHHHLKIENSYVRAYYVEVAPHDSTLLHQHDLDYLYVILGPADIINAVAGKPELHQVLKDGEVHFTRGGFAHVARNLSDAPFRNVTIEFLRPQGKVHNLCISVIPNEPPTWLCHFPRPDAPIAHSSKLFDTDELVAELHSLGPKVRAPGSKAKKGGLLVFHDGSSVRAELPHKTSMTLKGGDVLWVDAGSRLKIINLKQNASSSYLSLIFKDSAASSSSRRR